MDAEAGRSPDGFEHGENMISFAGPGPGSVPSPCSFLALM